MEAILLYMDAILLTAQKQRYTYRDGATLQFILLLVHSGLCGPVTTWVAGGGPPSVRYTGAQVCICNSQILPMVILRLIH